MARPRSTTDHDTIRRWVEERGGHPARVKGAGKGRTLRIDFPPFRPEAALERISWQAWFEIFEKDGLAFHCLDRSEDGQVSRDHELRPREGPGAHVGPR